MKGPFVKNQNLIVLGLAAVAVFLILRTTRNTNATGTASTATPPARRNPYYDQWPTGPNGEGLF